MSVTKMFYDDGLRLDYSLFCETHFEHIFFGYHLSDLAIRKFRFNEIERKFEEVKCANCCEFNNDRMA
uniref:Uncharacterized protein n=1 Tax=Caenorhabditis japonica TaxID=281687 RepID=A0A8R1IUU4_CAEJA